MKKYISLAFISVILIAIIIISCNKGTTKESTLTLAKYKELTLNSAKQKSNTRTQYRTAEDVFPTIDELDFHNTIIHEQIDSGNVQTQAYVTRIIRNEEQVAEIVGFLANDNRLLNVVYVYEPIEDSVWKINVHYIDGTKIGSYKIIEGTVTDVEIEREIEEGTPAAQARSWWACTKECVSDAHIACYMDKECMTMLLISNIHVPGTLSGGLGSFSISVACGAVCAKNTNTDLLPQY